MSDRELADVTRQLATLARLGFPLSEGLKSMGERSRWLDKLGDDLNSGDSLAQATRRYPRLFSSFYSGMVSAAESAPDPQAMLLALSRWLEQSQRVEQLLRSALLYPVLVSWLLLLQLLLLVQVIMPNLVWPLGLASGTLPIWQGSLMLLGVGSVLTALIVAPGASGPLGRALPGLRNLRLQADQALFARALGSLLAAGVPVPEALEKACAGIGDVQFKSRLENLTAQVRRGSDLAASAATCGLDAELLWALQLEDAQEEPAARLLFVADSLEERVENEARARVEMCEPVATALVGLGVLFAVLLFWYPFYTSVGGLGIV